ncbi:hypothetical protein [Shewanella sp. UCD-KL12]|uniref:hypothetical protein n=1 Tax=Shewanella sp. UCD-KL12 TaxID=1917163 RepID=UPI00118089A1|nr:hypothetical protein [Shewanella sp. UCD-KL12]
MISNEQIDGISLNGRHFVGILVEITEQVRQFDQLAKSILMQHIPIVVWRSEHYFYKCSGDKKCGVYRHFEGVC